MPFKSQAQRRFMYSQHPRMAKRWERETPKGKLPAKKESEEMPKMESVFEAKKGKKADFGGPGKQTKVDGIPNCHGEDSDRYAHQELDPASDVKIAESFVRDVERVLGVK